MAEDFDVGFELLPSDTGEVSSEALLAAALAATPITPPADTKLPLGRGWEFDFEAGQFVRFGTSPVSVTGLANLRQWIEKTLRTARIAHPIYSDQYGMDYLELIGNRLTSGGIALYAQAITEALKVHDRISDVTDFTFSYLPEEGVLLADFTVVTDSGDLIDTSTNTGI